MTEHSDIVLQALLRDPKTIAAMREFVISCNNLRSAQAEASSFVSGRRVDALLNAHQGMRRNIADLADLFEQFARSQLGDGPQPAPVPKIGDHVAMIGRNVS